MRSLVVRERAGAGRLCRRWVAAIAWPAMLLWTATLPLAAEEPRLDLYGDPLPPGVVARLGTVRLRHGGQNKVAAFAPHGDELCTSSSDRRLLFWDVHTGRIVAEYSTGAFRPRAFAWSPDGSRLAVLGYGSLPPENAPHGNVQIVDRTSLELTAAFTWPGRTWDGDVAFLPDGETIVVGGDDGTLRILNTAVREELLTLQIFQRPIEGLAVSPDGETIAAVARNEPLALFRWLEQAEPLRVDIGERGALGVSFSADGETLALACDSTYGVPLHDGLSGAFRGSVPDPAERDHLRTVSWSPDGRFLAVSSDIHKAVVLYDAATRQEARRLPIPSNRPNSLSFSADSKLVAAVGFDSAVRVWRVESGERLGAAFVGHEDDPAARLAWSTDGTRIATGNGDGTARVWDAATGRAELLVRHESFVGGVAFSPDGRFLVTSSSDDTVRFWQMPDGQEVFRLPGHARLGLIRRDLRFTPDGLRCASCGGDMYLRLWNVANAKAVAEHALQPDGVDFTEIDPGSDLSLETYVDDSTFSSDGRLFGLMFRQKVYVYDAESGQEKRRIELPPGGASRLAFAPDGRRIVTSQRAPPKEISRLPNGQATYEQVDEIQIRVWDLKSGALTREITVAGRGWGNLGLANVVDILAVNNNEDPTTVYLFDLSSGGEVHRIEGCPSVRSLAFSPDDSRLAADIVTGEVLVWDVAAVMQRAVHGKQHEGQEGNP